MSNNNPALESSRSRAWRRGWFVILGALIGAGLGAVIFWLFFPQQPSELSQQGVNLSTLEDALGPIFFDYYFYPMCVAMYGVAPGALIGASCGFLTWRCSSAATPRA